MRQVILDTETTGLASHEGHRIIEIGCIELVNRKFTGQRYHQYINPQRKIDEEEPVRVQRSSVSPHQDAPGRVIGVLARAVQRPGSGQSGRSVQSSDQGNHCSGLLL